MSTSTCIFLLALMVRISCVLGGSEVYVVQMDPTKVGALDHSLGGSKRWFDSVMETLMQLEAEENEEMEAPQLLYVYETTLTGFSAKLTPKQVELLETLDGFLHASPDELLSLHTTHSPQFLGLHPSKGLWSSPRLASDVIVGVVDSGIWPEHVSFHDAGLGPVPSRWKGKCEKGTKLSTSNCNKKLIGARAFFKGYEMAAGRINETVDYRSARDSSGHGTHTASTVGGGIVPGASMLGVAKGVAGGMSYAARVAAYKVCWASGCASSDILAAIDQAVADGVDVLSLSLGGGARPYYADKMATATFGAVQKGVFVSCSAGNSGPSASTVSNTAPWHMTVAASYLDRSFPTTIQLGDGRTFKGASLYTGKPTGKLQLVYGHSAGGEGAEFCLKGSLSPKLVKGKMVACDRGMNNRVEKGELVKLAGGAAMLLLNSAVHGEELLTDAHVLPASTLGATAGKAIRDYVATTAKRPTARIVFEGTRYGETAPTMAAFSSRGPSLISPEVLKPDVTAPGVNILAAWPPTVSPSQLTSDKRRVSFNIVSGTSMSCPHVSGLAALLRSIHRDWSPAAIKSALMTTAYTDNNRNVPMTDVGSGLGQAATPFAFGSGHVDPERAADPGLIYDIATEDYLNFLCSLNYNSTQIAVFALKSYDCPKNKRPRAGDLNYPSFALIVGDGLGNSTVTTYTRTVTNVGKPGKYVARVSPPAGVSVTIEPSVLEFRQIGEKKSYKARFVASGGGGVGSSSFGELVWESGAFSVRSPIAVMWK